MTKRKDDGFTRRVLMALATAMADRNYKEAKALVAGSGVSKIQSHCLTAASLLRSKTRGPTSQRFPKPSTPRRNGKLLWKF
jgi:hypothetical protein